MSDLKTLLQNGRHITKINGITYDITEFIAIHPGGDIIKGISNGNDGTAMFYSSHFNLPDIDNIPSIHKIEDVKDIITPGLNFDYNKDSFYFTLKSDIQNYFKKNNIDYRVPTSFATCCLILNMCLFSILYYMSYVKGYTLCSILMGMLSWNFAGTLAHDHGAHRTVCGKRDMIGNIFMSFFNSLTFPGAFETHFLYGHYSHHTMVHDVELDSDENLLYPLVRLHTGHKRLWFHKYQFLYWPLAFSVYLISYISQTFRSKKNNWWRRHNHLYRPTVSSKFKVLVLSFIIFHVTVPVYYNGIIRGILSYLLFLFTYSTGGLFFALINHYIGHSIVIDHPDKNKWCFNTVQRSGDYLVDNKYIHYISGGFNVHGLHHLFPTIHPSHLPDIYHLYEKRCIEFEYPYINIKSFSYTFIQFIYNLYILGSR